MDVAAARTADVVGGWMVYGAGTGGADGGQEVHLWKGNGVVARADESVLMRTSTTKVEACRLSRVGL